MWLEKYAVGAQFESAGNFAKLQVSVGESPVLAQCSVCALDAIASDEQDVRPSKAFHVLLQSLQRHKQRRRRDLAGLQAEASELAFTDYFAKMDAKSGGRVRRPRKRRVARKVRRFFHAHNQRIARACTQLERELFVRYGVIVTHSRERVLAGAQVPKTIIDAHDLDVGGKARPSGFETVPRIESSGATGVASSSIKALASSSRKKRLAPPSASCVRPIRASACSSRVYGRNRPPPARRSRCHWQVPRRQKRRGWSANKIEDCSGPG